MRKSEEIHQVNKNFRYFIWTFVGIFILIGLASAYVYVTDTGIDMDDNLINNVTDPVNDQDAATKAYVDSSSGMKILSFNTTDFSTTEDGFFVNLTTVTITGGTISNIISILAIFGDDDDERGTVRININGISYEEMIVTNTPQILLVTKDDLNFDNDIVIKFQAKAVSSWTMRLHSYKVEGY